MPGQCDRPIKVTILGAGSTFTLRLANDIMNIPGNQGGRIALVDVDRKRLRQMKELVERVAAERGADRWTVQASTERTRVLRGTDYIISCIEVSGVECVRFDNDIPAKYGVDQCIGDTIGPGGLFKGLRTIPVWLEILRDIEEHCPRALVLNYTNPMNMMCLASYRSSSMPVLGLCHSVQGTSQLLARWADVPYEELEWECAGINHLAWFTKLEHRGKDLYPRLKQRWARDVAGRIPGQEKEARDRDLVRKDMALHFGAFITESSGHLSEYLPYYRKRDDLLKRYTRPRYDGESSFYANNWPQWRASADQNRAEMLKKKETPLHDRSFEYASWIIEAREKNSPWRIHGNVYNRAGNGGRLISNLPDDGCVEVACLVDRNGVAPTRFGALPPQMAAICNSNMSMFDLGAQAAIEKSVEKAIHALMLDPLCATVCSPEEIKRMTLELFEAEADFLPGFE